MSRDDIVLDYNTEFTQNTHCHILSKQPSFYVTTDLDRLYITEQQETIIVSFFTDKIQSANSNYEKLAFLVSRSMNQLLRE